VNKYRLSHFNKYLELSKSPYIYTFKKLRHMRKLLMLVAGLLLFGPMLTAQNRKISGKVTDDSGTPVPFATITVKSTKQGVAADASGNFSLSAKTGDVLVVSATGFDPIEVKVGTEGRC
jgi:hypothetical protein